MQNYTYSTFSLLAIVLHLIVNFNVLRGRGAKSPRYNAYRGFLFGVLLYYVSDAAWGLFAGLKWTRILYIDTIFYFISLVIFIIMLSRFVIVYMEIGKWPARLLTWYGYAILAFNIVLMIVNTFNNCFFYFDENGNYLIGKSRFHAFAFQIAMNILIATVVLIKALLARDTMRRRGMMVFLSCTAIAVAVVLQVVWPLTPFTALGLLITLSFFQVYVIQEDKAAKHMADIEKALFRARAAERARNMFFSIVSHDIRTPLNAILGYSELLQFDGIKNKEEREEALTAIRSCGQTLLQLVNDVLDLAKMNSGKMQLQPAPLHFDRLTNDVFSSFRMDASHKGIELVNRTSGVPTVLLDGHRFRQILFNLVGNALKFTERGSITVEATYAYSTLNLSVTDTGCGIPENMRLRILDPFVQVQDPSHAADRHGGTGLGLSICNSLVKAMGGELTVESEIGKGSKFIIKIPNVPLSTIDAAAANEQDNMAPKVLPKHVLVVDDSSVNRAVLTALLKRIGITNIKHACDGRAALEEIEAAAKTDDPYDLVLSDFWMPNMNGLEFIEKLRADSRFKSLKVYAVTADTEYHNDIRHRLFTGVLLKPLTYAKLVEVVSVSG